MIRWQDSILCDSPNAAYRVNHRPLRRSLACRSRIDRAMCFNNCPDQVHVQTSDSYFRGQRESNVDSETRFGSVSLYARKCNAKGFSDRRIIGKFLQNFSVFTESCFDHRRIGSGAFLAGPKAAGYDRAVPPIPLSMTVSPHLHFFHDSRGARSYESRVQMGPFC